MPYRLALFAIWLLLASATLNAQPSGMTDLDDFSPDAVARKVDSLNKLLEARTQLSNLVTYMDGKTGAEELIASAIKDPALLSSLVAAPKPDDGSADEGGE